MELTEGLGKAIDADAMLFIGAGFSSGAGNLIGRPFLRGSELASFLAKQVGLPSETNLDDAAEAYADKKGADALIDALRKQFSAKGVKTHHRKLAQLPWKRVYTTNYDKVLVHAY